MKYLVTGGTGFIGSALIDRLHGAGHKTVSLAGDVRDTEVVSIASEDCDAVIHLAYVQRSQASGYANSADVLDVAVRGMASVLTACVINGISDLMLVSSSLVYQGNTGIVVSEDAPLIVPDTLNLAYAHGTGKIASEMMAAAWAQAAPGRRLIIARPHNIYGPGMGREHVIPQFCLAMKELDASIPDGTRVAFPVQGTGRQTRSFCWIGDCAAQLMLALRKGEPPGIYNVGSADERTIASVAHDIAELYGRRIEVIPGAEPEGAARRRIPDLTRIEKLGWDEGTAMPFAEGLERTVDWYRSHG